MPVALFVGMDNAFSSKKKLAANKSPSMRENAMVPIFKKAYRCTQASRFYIPSNHNKFTDKSGFQLSVVKSKQKLLPWSIIKDAEQPDVQPKLGFTCDWSWFSFWLVEKVARVLFLANH